jgi:hypothetical protein
VRTVSIIGAMSVLTEAVHASEKSVYFHDTTRRHIPEACHLQESSSLQPRPNLFWDPLSILSNGYQELFLRGRNALRVKLTIHINLVPSLRMSGPIGLSLTPPIPLRGGVLDQKGDFTFKLPGILR